MRNGHLFKSPRRQWLYCLVIIGWAAILSAWAEVKFETLEAGGMTYKKVTVTSKTDRNIFINHSMGFATVKVADLDPMVQRQLGYDLTTVKAQSKQKMSFSDLPIDPKFMEQHSESIALAREQLGKVDKNVIIASLCLAFASYLFFCYCCHLICLKSGKPSKLAVWIPVIQYVPLLNAAGMRFWWFFLFFTPLAIPFALGPVIQAAGPQRWWLVLLALLPPVLTYVVWCFKICQGRVVSPVWGLMLLFPPTQSLAFLYLAFGASTATLPKLPRRGAGTSPGEEAYRPTNQDTSFFYQTQRS